jgi:hypothetical protein
MPTLLLVERICFKVFPANDPSPILADAETFISMYLATWQGINGRLPARDRLIHVVDMRERHIARTPENQVTMDDKINLAPGLADLGFTYNESEEYSPSEPLISRAITIYQEIGTEDSLPIRSANQLHELATVRTRQRRFEEAKAVAERALAVQSFQLRRGPCKGAF